MPAGSEDFAGGSIPDTEYSEDDGQASAELQAALRTYEADPSSARNVLRTLALSRLLVPVVAVVDETGVTEAGHAVDKKSTMASVMIQNELGQRLMLAFTSVDSLAAWRADARPVPVRGITAARAAKDEGAHALLVDVAGPITFAVAATELSVLAEARTVPKHADDASALRAGLHACLADQPGLLDARLNANDDDAALVLMVEAGIPRAEYDHLIGAITQSVGQLESVHRAFPGGLRVRVVGPGSPLSDTPSLIHRLESSVGHDQSHVEEHG